MNSDLFTCQFCKDFFSMSREPFLLPDCGHSVCAECLKVKLTLKDQFVCKEDGHQQIKVFHGYMITCIHEQTYSCFSLEANESKNSSYYFKMKNYKTQNQKS